jgi:hypothetical protein
MNDANERLPIDIYLLAGLRRFLNNHHVNPQGSVAVSTQKNRVLLQDGS